jgi:hypothetical protein
METTRRVSGATAYRIHQKRLTSATSVVETILNVVARKVLVVTVVSALRQSTGVFVTLDQRANSATLTKTYVNSIRASTGHVIVTQENAFVNLGISAITVIYQHVEWAFITNILELVVVFLDIQVRIAMYVLKDL